MSGACIGIDSLAETVYPRSTKDSFISVRDDEDDDDDDDDDESAMMGRGGRTCGEMIPDCGNDSDCGGAPSTCSANGAAIDPESTDIGGCNSRLFSLRGRLTVFSPDFLFFS